MQFVVNNHKVFASTGGRPFDKKKPVIIFLHGSGFDHTVWMLQTRYFAFHGYSVLALDLPGHGLSKGQCLTSIEDMADWIKSVMKSLGCKEASLVGHSQGCLISLECASRFPSLIKTVTLMGGSGSMPVNPLLLELAEKNDFKVVDLMMDWCHGPAGQFGTHAIPGMSHVNIGAAIITTKPLSKTLALDLHACNNYKNGFEVAKNLIQPVLSILGDQDKMCPPKTGKKLTSLIKDCDLKVIKNCGHMMHLEEANTTLSLLKKFINSHYKTK
ncbi:alpha/beta hydrolase [Alphaproteobacteria bacterium]|nr:alpha/beta hydrolase [Alphaproteobacteria bacterium]